MKQVRFNSLTSKGPLFPQEYKPIGYKLAGEVLPKLAEEMLWNATRFIGNDYEKEAFAKNSNIWVCLKSELTDKQQKLRFPEDFMPLLNTMKDAQEAIKLEKKQRSKEEKLIEKSEKEKLKEIYGFANVDGQQIQLGNYQIEPPGWIVTRGKDPRKFNWKYRVTPEEVELNIVNEKPPKNWNGGIYSDNTSQFVARYKVKCGRKETKTYKELPKLIPFVSWSPMRLKNSEGKFDKTADILKNWKKIQNHIYSGCLASDENALVAYLIQQTGIRIGGERDLKTQADTKGASTLLKVNIELL
jgi:hypothetical protein